MTTFALNRVDEGHHGEKWQLKLEDRSAQLQTPDGQIAASYTPEEAYPRFELVRFSNDFSGNAHNFAITDGQNTWRFAVWPKAFKQIKAFVQKSPEASSEIELGKIRRRAIFQTVLGGICVLGGIILSMDTSYIFYGAVVAGAMFLFMGYYHFAEHKKLRQAAS